MKRSPITLAVIVLLAGAILFTSPLCSRALEKAKPPGPSLQAAEEIPDWMARWELARTLGYARRYDESVSEYRKLLKERPDLSKARIEMAKILFGLNKNQEALAALESVDRRQLDPDAALLMADLYRTRKSYTMAHPLYRDYLNKRPDDQSARLRFAEMLSWEKEYEESLAEYRKILAVMPDDVQVRRKYALVLMWSKKNNEAAAELRRTLK